jgi:DNA-binding NarL/FixJ family response regulator
MRNVTSNERAIGRALDADPRERTRLLVVDDHAAVRAGLRDLLGDESDFDVVAVVATAQEALSVAQSQVIDSAILDYHLGGRTGLWLSRKLKRLHRPPAVLIYSAYADAVLSAAAVVAEADGVISKSSRGSELCDAIRAVTRGKQRLSPVPPWLSEALRHRLGHEEQAIFGMLLTGIARDEIAETLGISSGELDSRMWAMLRALESPRADTPVESITWTAA